MKFIAAFFSILFIGITLSLGAQNSPVVTLGTITTSASTVVVPVKVVNFSNIKACDLKILYNPAMVKPTAITKGIGLGGSVNINISAPGEIVIGWYSGFSVSLTDNSSIFNISFNKVSNGTSTLNFDLIADNDCQFYNGSGVKLNDVPSGTYYIPGSLNMDNESPVTTAPTLTPSVNDIINVPIKVTGFNNIGAVSLMLNYDPLVLNYNSSDNTGGFPDMIVHNPIPGTISVSGTNTKLAGYSLADSSVFFTLNFTYMGGTSLLNWFDNGESCEYASQSPDYFVLNDIPKVNYYVDGSVKPNKVTAIPTIAVGTITNPTTCGGNGTIPLIFTNVPDGTYIINYDGGTFPNIAVSARTASIGAPAGTYNNLQITLNGVISAEGVNVVLTDPEKPSVSTITAGGTTIFCQGGSVTLTSDQASAYQWSTGETTKSITVSAAGNYSVTVSNASGCSATSEITVVTVNAKPEKPAVVNCWDDYQFNTALCAWENKGTQQLKPEKKNCWDNFIFNNTTCAWDNTGTQATKPATVNCWDEFSFNTNSCSWENTGIQPVKPTTANCWDDFTFNTNSCIWENTGVQPVKPTAANCWDDYRFNETLCTWENKGTAPFNPEKKNCWDNFVFNSATCVWDNTGTQATKPATVNCWDEFSFNTNSCSWENTGIQPVKPTASNCWDDYRFNETLCKWENKGTKPVQPAALKSWDDFVFNTNKCIWENIGVATSIHLNSNTSELTLNCYPNPFTEKAAIHYLLPVNGQVTIEMTGITGNRIKLLSSQFQSAGEYVLDLKGTKLTTGIYQINLRFTDLKGGSFTKTVRVIKQ